MAISEQKEAANGVNSDGDLLTYALCTAKPLYPFAIAGTFRALFCHFTMCPLGSIGRVMRLFNCLQCT